MEKVYDVCSSLCLWHSGWTTLNWRWLNKDVLGHGYAPSYNNCCISLFTAFKSIAAFIRHEVAEDFFYSKKGIACIYYHVFLGVHIWFVRRTPFLLLRATATLFWVFWKLLRRKRFRPHRPSSRSHSLKKCTKAVGWVRNLNSSLLRGRTRSGASSRKEFLSKLTTICPAMNFVLNWKGVRWGWIWWSTQNMQGY